MVFIADVKLVYVYILEIDFSLYGHSKQIGSILCYVRIQPYQISNILRRINILPNPEQSGSWSTHRLTKLVGVENLLYIVLKFNAIQIRIKNNITATLDKDNSFLCVKIWNKSNNLIVVEKQWRVYRAVLVRNTHTYNHTRPQTHCKN